MISFIKQFMNQAAIPCNKQKDALLNCREGKVSKAREGAGKKEIIRESNVLGKVTLLRGTEGVPQ